MAGDKGTFSKGVNGAFTFSIFTSSLRLYGPVINLSISQSFNNMNMFNCPYVKLIRRLNYDRLTTYSLYIS
jgi:hypothetical protein